MGRSIEISEETYEGLKRAAQDPFEDTPEIVIKRLLRQTGCLPPDTRDSAVVADVRRGLSEGKTPEAEFREPIIQAIREKGGSGKAHEIADRVHELMKDRLRAGDYEPVSSGELRWRNATGWAKWKLKDEGVIRSDSPHGVWALNDERL